jgi:hypothetical protein
MHFVSPLSDVSIPMGIAHGAVLDTHVTNLQSAVRGVRHNERAHYNGERILGVAVQPSG